MLLGLLFNDDITIFLKDFKTVFVHKLLQRSKYLNKRVYILSKIMFKDQWKTIYSPIVFPFFL